MSSSYETILYVNLKTLEENFNFLKNTVSEHNKIIAVVKAFAYGLGDVQIAKKLELLGVDGFWVADFEEGVQLRQNGITKPIIVANPGFKSMSMVLDFDLEPVIYNHRMLDLYCKNETSVNVHLKFNTGMNRYGFEMNDLDDLIKKLNTCTHINIKSICSHLSSSNDSRHDFFSNKQRSKLEAINNRLNDAFKRSFPKHILNSNGIFRFDVKANDWIRLGISLYGGIEHQRLNQIFTLKSVVNQIRDVYSGDFIGYQNSFKVTKPMKIAIIPVGYADGLNRKLSHSKGHIMINGEACSILGEISMDSMVVDVSNIQVKEGDEVIIFSPKHSVIQLSNRLGTIPYEIMASLNRRIKRVYLNE